MGGRHAGDKEPGGRGGVKYGVGLVAVAIALTAVFVLRDGPGPATADCASKTQVSVAVAPEVETLVADAAERARGDSCAGFDVEAQAPALTAQSVTLDDGAPDLWIPDSSLWVTRVTSQLVAGAPAPRTVVGSLATTPVVLAWPKDDSSRPSSWLSTLTDASFTIGDPLGSATATAPLLAAYAEAATGITPTGFGTVNAAQVTLAQRQSADPPSTDAATLLAAVAKAGGGTVVSEQAFNANPKVSAGFDAVLPGSASVALQYPLLALDDDPVVAQAASRLADALTSSTGRKAFTDAGFRDPLGEPLSSGRSVGDFQALTLKDDTVVADTIKRWSLVALPARALAVVDVSRSMKKKVGGETKMKLIVEAALKGLGLMPDSWALGSWAFSDALDGKKDWRQLASIRTLGSAEGRGTHRDTVVSKTRALKATGGRTGLYDTVLAAYRTVQADYDPKAVNSVIILTGGRNDAPGGISQSKLIATLQRERDPARPVVVIAIGVTKDADAFALQKIAQATGGQVYLAHEPDEISDVFINALQSRY